MKRILYILVLASLIAALRVNAAEKLSPQQLASLIASARTPQEHQRIANYYRSESDRLLAEANDHARMAAAFHANPVASNDKMARGTVGHCEYLAKALKAQSNRARSLAEDHERMAQSASLPKVNPPSR